MPTRLCGNPPAFRFTWPGKDEAVVCLQCATGVVRVANAIGLHLQLLRIHPEQQKLACPQNIPVRPNA